METTAPHRHLYDEVRRLVLALLDSEGVTGIVLLDRDGRLVIHEGPEPLGDVEGIAGRFLAIGRAVSGLGREPADRLRSWSAGDERHAAWLAPAGSGLTLVVFRDVEANPGLAWRVGEVVAVALAALLGGETASRVEPTPPADAVADDPDPIWE